MTGEQTTPPRRGHMQLALQYCSDSWYPANPLVVKSTLAAIKAKESKELIIREIKSDSSLYNYCVREISLKYNVNDLAPSAVLEECSTDDIFSCVNKEACTFSKHSYTLEPMQINKLQESMISSSATEALAPYAGINPGLAFSCATLRQLGSLLIAWNYPHVYRRSLTLIKPDQDLDTLIGKILGFSPSQISTSLTQRWGFSKSIVEIISRASAKEPKLRKVQELAEIGEKIARATSRTKYPSAEKDWDLADEAINNLGGINAWQSVTSRIIENCRNYIKSLPDIFCIPERISRRSETSDSNPNLNLINKNEYLVRCNIEFVKLMHEFYGLIKPEGLSRGAIEVLCRYTLPKIGFSRGCLYFTDPHSKISIPRIAIGSSSTSDYLPVSQLSTAESGPIAKAIKNKGPIAGETNNSQGEVVTYFASRIGDSQDVGAIYLERHNRIPTEQLAEYLKQLKAIKQALQDALKAY